MTLLHVVLLLLAVYRGTILLTKDYICEPLRRWMRQERAVPHSCGPSYEVRWPHFYYLSTCPWCCSMWVATALVPLTVLVSWFWTVDLVLACSAVTGVAMDGVRP